MFTKKSLLFVLTLVLIYSCENKQKGDPSKIAYVDTFSIMKQYDQAKIIEEKYDSMLRDKDQNLSDNSSNKSFDYYKDIEIKKKAALDSLNRDVCKIIYQYAHNNGYENVYGSSQNASEYKGKKNDITQEILLLLNSQINYSEASETVADNTKINLSKAISEKAVSRPENEIITNSGTDNTASFKKTVYKNEVKPSKEATSEYIKKEVESTKKDQDVLEIKSKIKEAKIKVKSLASTSSAKKSENSDLNSDAIKSNTTSQYNKKAALVSKSYTSSKAVLSETSKPNFVSNTSSKEEAYDEKKETLRLAILQAKNNKGNLVQTNNDAKTNNDAFFSDNISSGNSDTKKESLRLAILEAQKSKGLVVNSKINSSNSDSSFFSDNLDDVNRDSKKEKLRLDVMNSKIGNSSQSDNTLGTNSRKGNAISSSVNNDNNEDADSDDFFQNSSSNSDSKKEDLRRTILEAQQDKSNRKFLINKPSKTDENNDDSEFSTMLADNSSNTPALNLDKRKASVPFLVEILKEFDTNQNFLFSSLDSISSVFDKNNSNRLLVIEPGSKENKLFQSLTKEIDEKNIRQKELLVKFESLYNEMTSNDSFTSANSQYFNTLNKLNSDQKNIEKLYEDLFQKVSSYQNEGLANKIRTSNKKSDTILKGIDKSLATKSKQKAKGQNLVSSVSDKFDYGYELTNLQVLKNVDNAEKEYYLIVAVHNDKDKAVSFINQVLSTGEKNINYFYSSKFDSYFIYTDSFKDINSGLVALENKVSRKFNEKMVLVKFEK